jgi:hypothetical protein
VSYIAVNLYLEVDGESKGYRQVKCESKTHELELLVSNLMDPVGERGDIKLKFMHVFFNIQIFLSVRIYVKTCIVDYRKLQFAIQCVNAYIYIITNLAL